MRKALVLLCAWFGFLAFGAWGVWLLFILIVQYSFPSSMAAPWGLYTTAIAYVIGLAFVGIAVVLGRWLIKSGYEEETK